MKRNHGIDLLRLTAMLFVAALHILGIGGVIAGAELLSAQFLTAQFLRIAMLCAVDCYALISGFVGWQKRPRWSSAARLWVKAVFYCVTITAMISRFTDIDSRTALNALLPVTTGQYWYLTAYMGLFVLMPLLNFAVQQMPRRELAMTLGGILTLFCILPISPLTDAFYLHDGYSVLWLAVIYLLGGYLGKYDVLSRLSGQVWGLVFLGSVLFAWAPRMAALWLKPSLWGMSYGNILIEYTSPTIVLAAAALLALFSRLRLPRWADALTVRLSPCAFGVYLSHAHPLVFRHVLQDRFSALGTGSVGALVLTVFAAAAAICVFGLAADRLVNAVLSLTRVDRLLKKLDRQP